MRVKRCEYGAMPECKGGGNGRSPRKPTDQRHRPARFPLAKIQTIGSHGVWHLLENGVQLPPSTATANNQCAGDIGICVHKIVESSLQRSCWKCLTHGVFFLFQVVDIMKTNVEKVLERDQKLSELDDRAATHASKMASLASNMAEVRSPVSSWRPTCKPASRRIGSIRKLEICKVRVIIDGFVSSLAATLICVATGCFAIRTTGWETKEEILAPELKGKFSGFFPISNAKYLQLRAHSCYSPISQTDTLAKQ
ncbi:hypothetical protein PR048_014048 [Dryococelus australis]|uniref:V-SNARE coiled-coil homology domain-containing protein n=1 Tax=Dryococelus australis TaxID=614101 RepID=A0ABQ9HUT9_9NEOP|nr:hypothetical protein PR048_014048 [Dryococelus australis]